MYRFAVVVCLATLISVPMQSAQQPVNGSFAVEHVTVINVANGARAADQTVVVSGNRIAAVGPAATVRVPPGARTVDGRGKFLIPGMWDMHVHILYALPARTLPFFAARGMTGVREMGGPIDKLSEARKLIDEGIVAPRFFAPGPLVVGAPLRADFAPGVGLVVKTPEEGRAAVHRLVAQRVDFIKMQQQMPKEIALAIADEAKRYHLPYVGHLPLDMTMTEASDAGFHSVEHLYSLTASCVSDPAVLAAAPNTPPPTTPIPIDRGKCEAAIQRIAKNGTWFCPMILAPGTGNPRTRAFNLAVLQMAFKGGIKLLAGTDAPGVMYYKGDYSVAGRLVQDDLAGMVEAGLTPLEALRTATINPAMFLNMADQLGSVETGKLADMVVLDADPLIDIANTRRVSAVVLGGRLIDSAMRQKLLDDEMAAQRANPKSN